MIPILNYTGELWAHDNETVTGLWDDSDELIIKLKKPGVERKDLAKLFGS